ncbi:MAG: ABC transporter substrate-binding protein, partial [Halalkalicoccus sp.]
MALDERRWVEEVGLGAAIPGSTVIPPAAEGFRPETAAEEPIRRSPDGEGASAMNALTFRGTDGEPAVDALRTFLESGTPISGRSGTYAGNEYPGSLTGVEIDAGARYDYEFGGVHSTLLEEEADAELYVDGRTIEELNDGPLTMLSPARDASPRRAAFLRSYATTLRRLGIPIEIDAVTPGVLADRLYLDADFDVAPIGWSRVPTRGVATLSDLFHSDNARENAEGFAPNVTGYGLDAGADEAIEDLRAETDEDRRTERVRRLVERLYLDAPVVVAGHSRPRWPVAAGAFGGFLDDVPGVGSAALRFQALSIHRR